MIYAVTLYVRGKPYVVTVDNKVPVVYRNYRKHPYFADIYRSHTWTPILEKAMAKVMGSYDQLMDIDNHPINGLKMLTGVPVFNINFGNDAGVDKSTFAWNNKPYNHIAASINSEIFEALIDN
jgi:hypothetical protein